MITDYLINGLKDLFHTLGAKTTDSNYAVGLFDKTSGEPKGIMGMSDLASVLGGLLKIKVIDVNGSQSLINTHVYNGLAFLILTGNYSTSFFFHYTDTTETVSVMKKDPNFDITNYISKSSSNTLRVKLCQQVVIFGV